jgi:transcriptional regulator with XRE-family HTH domain
MRIGMSEAPRRIREARRRLNLKQSELAEALGVSQATISKWEQGVQRPDLSAMMKLAEMAGHDPIKFALEDDDHPFATRDWGLRTKVIGAVGYDRWVEDIRWEEDQHFEVQIPTLKDWDELDIVGFLVEDDSANLKYPKGSIVFVAQFKLNTVEPRHGDMVVYSRTDERGLFELTIREYHRTRLGDVFLTLETDQVGSGTNIELGKLSRFDVLAKGNYQDLGLIGVIVSSYTIENPTRFSGT